MQKCETKTCQSCKVDFTIEPEDFDFYEKIGVPTPTWCSVCRFKRRMIFRNSRKDIMRHDDATGEYMFSHIPIRHKNTVYNADYWRSDAWDPMDYGRDYDFNRPFFEQFRELWYSVPWPGQSVLGMVNSQYCDQAGYCKNAYLCFNGDEMEDSAYTNHSSFVKNCFDLTFCFNDELCYDCLMVDRSYRTYYSVDCEDCTDVIFSRDLRGCSYCLGCSNLRNASYCIFNKQHSKEEYQIVLKKLWDGSWSKKREVEKRAESFWLKFPVKFYHGARVVNSSGETLKDAKDCKMCHSIYDGENLKYCYQAVIKTKDSYDYSVWGSNSSLMYESQTCGEQANNIKFCFDCWPAIRDLEYCVYVRSSSNCFGSVGLRKKEFCIFNKQYEREEYKVLVKKIKEHMGTMPFRDVQGRVFKYGEFFPPEFSPFAYNETQLQDIFPLTKEGALAQGFTFEDVSQKEYETTLKAEDLSDSILEVNESVLKEKISCLDCGRVYRLIFQEFEFLQNNNLPLSRLCLECRFGKRHARINPPIYKERVCECGGEHSSRRDYKNNITHAHGKVPCGSKFQSAYSPDRPEIVYCESCYQQEVS